MCAYVCVTLLGNTPGGVEEPLFHCRSPAVSLFCVCWRTAVHMIAHTQTHLLVAVSQVCVYVCVCSVVVWIPPSEIKIRRLQAKTVFTTLLSFGFGLLVHKKIKKIPH